jgi:HlyD family secretion protein
MKNAIGSIIAVAAIMCASGCGARDGQFAYTGRMDTDTVTISAKAAGVVKSLALKEGDAVHKGDVLGMIETDRLEAQRQQQEAQLEELEARKDAADAQIQQAVAQLQLTRDTLEKTGKVLAEGGATRQRLDELTTEAQVGDRNITALQANLKVIAAQEDELRAGIRITDIAIDDARILSPLDGVVLDKFHYEGELVAIGTPLLEVADLSELTVKVYVPLERLPAVKIGGAATVTADGVKEPLSGTVSWISSEAEFTPKTILTQETRTTLVYGVKISVENTGGMLKIGMPVDVRF